MINRLVLNNFRTHAHLDVRFTSGLNGIFGANYTGKTTILYGILYCLGGASAVSGIELQTRGTTRGFEQELLFSCLGADYRVERGKTKANLYLQFQDGKEELLAAGTTAVNQKIEELIGLDMKLFKQLKYAQQKNTHALLTLGATGLHKIIDQITGIDDVNAIIKALVDRVMVDKGLLEELGELEDPATTAKELEAAEKALLHVEQSVEKLTKAYDKLKADRASMEKILQELRHSADLWDSYLQTKNQLEGSLETYQSLVEKSSQSLGKAPEAKLKKLETEVPKLKKAFEDQKKALEHADGARKDKLHAERAVASAQAHKDAQVLAETQALDTLEKHNYARDRYLELEKELAAKKANIAALSEKVEAAEAAVTSSVCPACKRPFEEAHDLLAMQKSLDTLRKALGGEEAEEEKLRIQLEKFKPGWKAFTAELANLTEEVRPSLRACERQLEEAAKTLTKAEESLKTLESPTREAVAEAEDAYQSAHKTLESLRSTLEAHQELLDDLAKIQKKLDALQPPDYDKEEHERLVDQYDNMPSLSELGEQLSNQRVVFAEKSAQVKTLKDQLNRINLQVKRKAEITAKLDVEKALLKFLRDNRDRFAAGVWGKFMGVASTFVSSCTGGALEEVRRTEDGAFTFVESGKEMSVKDASGAQASIMGLGVQIALADSTNTPLNVILVDEPTADMDPEHSMATAAMLASCAEQVIAVSHSQMDSSVCSNVISL